MSDLIRGLSAAGWLRIVGTVMTAMPFSYSSCGYSSIWSAMTITDGQDSYAASVAQALGAADFRVEKDFRNEKIGFKIREARLQKVPYMVIIGAKEESSETLSIRGRDEGELGVMAIPEFLALLSEKLPDLSSLRG